MRNFNYLRYKVLKPFKSWKNKYLKGISKKDAQRNDLYNKVAEEISAYTLEPAEVVKEKYKLGPQSEASYPIFTDQKNLSASQVKEFYKKCNYYIYELPLWNAERNRPKYLCLLSLPYIRRNKYKKVMDFGAGAGDLCMELAKNGLEVTYCEIGEKLYNFAQWRFKRRNLPIRMAQGLDHLGSQLYDCIYSFDAFEHIKDLPLILKQLISCLRPGGSLVFTGAFSGGTLHLEENEQFNRFGALDSLMRSCGLSFEDKFAQFYFYKKTLDK